MKAVPPRVMTCEKCATAFVADPSFYTACNCGPPLQCRHGDVELAVYSTHCPKCRKAVEVFEHIREIPKERR